MRLLRAKFENFRLLKELELEFASNPEKKLTVIRAANETGKTTILNGLQWGLYGDGALPGKGQDYHHHQNGSASIKKVLPAFVPELSYDGLNIGNGQDASQKYLDFMRGQPATPHFWRDLEEYCGLDTFAMVKLVQVLREKVTYNS